MKQSDIFIEKKYFSKIKKGYLTFFLAIILFCTFSKTFAQSTDKFFGMNYWEYAEYSPGQVTDLFKANINEIGTWNLGIIRIGGNYNNVTKNDPVNDKDWYVTAIVNAKSIGGTPLVQLPIDLTATQVGDWMDYFNVTKNLGVIYWGIGNEPDPSANFEAWYANTATADGRTFQQWAAQFKTIATKIKQKDVNSIICGPDFRHWWGTTTSGAFGTWYKDFLYNGPNAVGTATYNGDPLVDIFAFHFYGDGGSGNFDEGEISTKYATMMTLINSTNALRPAGQPLKVAVGEYQDNLNYSTYPFRVGQRLAIMSKQSLKNNAAYITPWSLSEGYGWSMISKTTGTFYPTAHHYKMMGQNKRDNFMTGEINNNNNYDIVEFGMQDANGYTIMLMNENTTTDFSYAVKFSTTAGDYSTKTGTIKFRFNAAKNIDFNGTISKASTLLFTFDSNGNMLKKMEYKSTDTNGPVTTPYNVNVAPTVSITAPVTGSSYTSGTSIALAATAADTAPGTVTSVSFYDGATLLGTDTSSPYSFTWAGATVGSHSITAKATDNNAAVTTSTAVTIIVNAANVAPTVSITAPVTGSSYTSGTSIALAATATDTAPGTVTSVAFYDGATLLGTDTSSPYSFTWAGATVGSHSITAKATDNNGAVTTSTAVAITVNAANVAPTVSITAPVTGSSYTSGTSIALAATATDTAPGTVTSVSFYDGATLLGTDTSSPYSFTWAGATVGSHSITAKATDNNGAVTTSTAVSVTVNAVVVTDPLTQSYYHLVDVLTADYMRPTAGGATATITQYEEAVEPTLDSYQWEFQTVTGTSYYYIVNKLTKNAIQPTGGVTTDNVGLSQTTLTATNKGLTELHWSIIASDQAPYYWIKNRKSGLYIRPNTGTNGTGVAIVQNTLNAAYSSFKWNLVNKGTKPVVQNATNLSAARESAELSEISEETNGATIYPNPANGIIYVSTEVAEPADVNINVYTMAGGVVLSKDFGNRVGKFNESIDVTGFIPGTYILKISKGEKTETKKLIKF